MRADGRPGAPGLPGKRQHHQQRQSPRGGARPAGREPLCLLHDNKPGMLNAFLEIIARGGINVEHMLNKARGDLAYTIFDTSPALDESVAEQMRTIPGVKRVRLLG